MQYSHGRTPGSDSCKVAFSLRRSLGLFHIQSTISYYPAIPANVQHSTWLGLSSAASCGCNEADDKRLGALIAGYHVNPSASRKSGRSRAPPLQGIRAWNANRRAARERLSQTITSTRRLFAHQGGAEPLPYRRYGCGMQPASDPGADSAEHPNGCVFYLSPDSAYSPGAYRSST